MIVLVQESWYRTIGSVVGDIVVSVGVDDVFAAVLYGWWKLVGFTNITNIPTSAEYIVGVYSVDKPHALSADVEY